MELYIPMLHDLFATLHQPTILFERGLASRMSNGCTTHLNLGPTEVHVHARALQDHFDSIPGRTSDVRGYQVRGMWRQSRFVHV